MSEAMRYVEDVLAGRRRECRWVRLACERHVNDLRTGHERGLWFDERAARTVIAFFGLLRHSKGEWAGAAGGAGAVAAVPPVEPVRVEAGGRDAAVPG
jgi:phage terminase large subunit-like protein